MVIGLPPLEGISTTLLLSRATYTSPAASTATAPGGLLLNVRTQGTEPPGLTSQTQFESRRSPIWGGPTSNTSPAASTAIAVEDTELVIVFSVPWLAGHSATEPLLEAT